MRYTYESTYALCEGQELTLNSFRIRIFPIKSSKYLLKIFTPKQMLQILLIALIQRKTSNASKKFLNEIRQIIFFVSSKK